MQRPRRGLGKSSIAIIWSKTARLTSLRLRPHSQSWTNCSGDTPSSSRRCSRMFSASVQYSCDAWRVTACACTPRRTRLPRDAGPRSRARAHPMQLSVPKLVFLLVGEPLAVVVDEVAQSGDPLRGRKDLRHRLKQPLHPGSGRVSRALVPIGGCNTPKTRGPSPSSAAKPCSIWGRAPSGPPRLAAAMGEHIARVDGEDHREARGEARWKRGARPGRVRPVPLDCASSWGPGAPFRGSPHTYSAGLCSDMTPPSSYGS